MTSRTKKQSGELTWVIFEDAMWSEQFLVAKTCDWCLQLFASRWRAWISRRQCPSQLVLPGQSKKIMYLAFRCTNIGFSCGFLSSLKPGPPVLESRGRPPELALRLEKQTPYVAQTGTGRRLESVPYAPWLYMGVMNLCESFFDRMKRQLYRKLDRH
jgi:hypothetical protein